MGEFILIFTCFILLCISIPVIMFLNRWVIQKENERKQYNISRDLYNIAIEEYDSIMEKAERNRNRRKELLLSSKALRNKLRKEDPEEYSRIMK